MNTEEKLAAIRNDFIRMRRPLAHKLDWVIDSMCEQMDGDDLTLR